MAQQQQKYTVEAFDYRSASKRKLVAMVNGSNNIIGTGILKVESPNKLILTVEGEEYIFNSDGNPVSDNAKTAKYKIMMGVSQVAAIDKGTVGTTNISMTRSVDSSGDVSYEADTTLDKSYEITIDNLNARDQFALQALHSIMERLPNADELSKDEITHYCEAAYTWAGYMMEMSSKARSVIKDADSSDNTKTEEVGYLENNTEKLLNNIVAALDKTNATITSSGTQVTAERVTIPEIKTLMEAYVAGKDNTTLGLKDLIDAIKGGSSDGTIQIGNEGLGRDSEHPIYISGGGFPSRAVLATAFPAESIHDLLTFNEEGAVGYSTKAEAKKALLGFLNDYADLTALYNALQESIDIRIKAWLNATTIIKDGDGWKLNVPNNI